MLNDEVLKEDKFSQLIKSARERGKSIQPFDGEQRARIDLLSYMTGIRPKESGSLSPWSFDLDSDSPTVTVEAATSKLRKKEVQPLHPELVVALREWTHCLKPADKLFPNLERCKAWLMVKQVLERVGMPSENHDGVADFHTAGGHTHITELLRNGATLPEAQKLARHSDIKLTMRYVHIGLGDQVKAVRTCQTVRCNCDAFRASLISNRRQWMSVSSPKENAYPPPAAIANGNEKQRAQATGTEAASNWRPDSVAVTTDFRGPSGAFPVVASGNADQRTTRQPIAENPMKTNEKALFAGFANKAFRVERKGVEPSTSALRTQRSPN